jgi:hypothetical protein
MKTNKLFMCGGFVLWLAVGFIYGSTVSGCGDDDNGTPRIDGAIDGGVDTDASSTNDAGLDADFEPDGAGETDGGAENDGGTTVCTSDHSIGGSDTEQEIIVSCGQTQIDAIIDTSGTFDQWVRYRAETPGCVTVTQSSDLPSEHDHYILDGWVFDLSQSTENNPVALSFRADNVGVENALFSGPLDVYKGEPNCSEDAVMSTGVMFNGHDNVWLERSEIHGFSTAVTFSAGAQAGHGMRLSCNYIHNNFNGIGPKGTDVVVEGNVLWMHPNHVLLIEDNAADVADHSVLMLRNLIVDTQEALFMYGGARYDFIRNTWYGEAQDCGIGLGLLVLDRSPSGNLLPQGPLTFLSNYQGGDSGSYSQFYRFEVAVVDVMVESDYNYGYRPDNRTRWARNSASDTNWELDAWTAAFGFDAHSINAGPEGDPGFSAPSIYPIPQSWQEAWQRFEPQPDSPLCGSAHNGEDIGAVRCAP